LRREFNSGPTCRFRLYRGLSVIFLCAFAFADGCGYHVAGRAANLPSGWHTLAIPTFINHTATYGIEQRVTAAVVHEILARTKYRVVPDPKGADAVLNGEITDIETAPLLFDANTGHVTTMLVTIKLKVALEDLGTKKIVYQNDAFVLRDEYQLSGDATKFFQEEDPAFGRMAREFARDLVSAILEGT
jgi:hypothetical protein